LGVFVDETAEAFTSLDLARRTRRVGAAEARCRCGRSQVERTMRSVGVVVLDVDAQDVLSAACDQEPIETVAADVPTQRSANALAFGARNGVR
jgi:hypothetical protein